MTQQKRKVQLSSGKSFELNFVGLMILFNANIRTGYIFYSNSQKSKLNESFLEL
jgi:hypothetical protein